MVSPEYPCHKITTHAGVRVRTVCPPPSFRPGLEFHPDLLAVLVVPDPSTLGGTEDVRERLAQLLRTPTGRTLRLSW